MKIEKEKPQVEPETQLLEEDELDKVSGGGPGPTDWIYVPRPKDPSATWTCSWCGEVMTQGDALSHQDICSKKPK